MLYMITAGGGRKEMDHCAQNGKVHFVDIDKCLKADH